MTADNVCIFDFTVRPDNDFHFYRLCSGGLWCHKPGKTAARNYDNSGVHISDPATCDRGPYTLVCGYYYADNSIMFVQ